MHFNKIPVLMLLFYVVIVHAETQPAFITLYCPPAIAIRTTKIAEPSWASYKYQAEASIDFPVLGSYLQLFGEGTAPQATMLQVATWTDRTFLCNYNEGLDAIVIFETSLDQYVKGCYFVNSAFHRVSECYSNDPLKCPLTCELGRPES